MKKLAFWCIAIAIHATQSTFAACDGTISRSKWNNIWWTAISAIPTSTEPNETGTYTTIEIPSGAWDNYGIIIEGKICPTETGNYTFHIKSDDNGELRLGTDATSTNATRIASVPWWTYTRQWTKYAEQTSSTIALVAGQEYYLKAIMKEGGGGDHLAVGWKTPSNNNITVINQNYIGSITTQCGNNTIEWSEFCDGNIWCPANTTCNSICSGCTPNQDLCLWKVNNTISYEQRDGIIGNDVASIPITTTPNSTGSYTSLESPTNVWNNFGRRIRGYICPMVSWEHTLYIASDDNSQLRLSSDASPANKTLRASVSSRTSPRQWTKFAGQASAPITLQWGTLYYIEALMKEWTWWDNFAVGRKTPLSQSINVIESNNISSYQEIVCGDGVVGVWEVCDDNNTTDGDGCSATCTVESTHTCDGASPTTCILKNLSLNAATTYSETITPSSQTQIVTINTADIFDIIDERWDENDRYVTLSATDMISPTTTTIPKSNISFAVTTLTTIAGTTNDAVSIAPGANSYQSIGSPITVITKSAGPNNGWTATYQINGNIQISVPAYSQPQTYTSTLTFTLQE